MAEDDYESLGAGYSFTTNALAGASAGYFEHLAVYPLDIVRTQYQTIRSGCKPQSTNPFKTVLQLYHQDGIRGCFRGSGAVFAGCGPAHALQFAVYELIKEGMEKRKILAGYNVSAGVAGAIGAIAHDAWMNPCDVVKQRLQVKGSPYVGMSYPSIISQIYRSEGIRAFYLSFPTQMATNVPFSFVQFAVYDKVQDLINPERAYDPVANCAAGAMAGGLAAFITTPLDVIKTALNTQESLLTTLDPNCEKCPVIEECKTTSGRRIIGFGAAFRTVLASSQSSNPLSPFFRGCLPRTLYYAPGTALSWFAYEAMKTLLHSNNGQKTKVVDPTIIELKQRHQIGE